MHVYFQALDGASTYTYEQREGLVLESEVSRERAPNPLFQLALRNGDRSGQERGKVLLDKASMGTDEA